MRPVSLLRLRAATFSESAPNACLLYTSMLIGIDYPSMTISSTKAVMPTGDIEKDMLEIKLYFKNFKGKNPEDFDLGNILSGIKH